MTKTYEPDTAGTYISVDGCGTYCNSLGGVVFTDVDLGANNVVTDVDVSITWLKTDGTCAAPGTGNSFHAETNFRLDGPGGTNVILAVPATWSGAADIGPVTTVFDQAAVAIPSSTPVSGTFLPNTGNLASLNGLYGSATWTLRAGDTGTGDPLCIDSYSVTVTAVPATADLSITKTDGVTTATPGSSVTYTITASNAGPNNVTGATVADTFPASLSCTWTCAGAGGGTCTAAGAGNINDTVNLPAGGSTTYTASCTISASASGTLANTATVAVPAGVTETNPANNSATDSDTLTSEADLSITKTDGVTTATPGGSVTYTITASNAGPSDAPGATVADTFPASLSCTWTCAGAGGGTCTAAGAGNINDTVNLPAGGSTTYTASCTISASASGTLANTATVAEPAGVTETNPANNSATDTDTLAPDASLSITKTALSVTAAPGDYVSYSIVASNAGPSNASGVSVTDMLPVELSGTWTCVGASGGTCTAMGLGDINDVVNLPAGASVTYSLVADISPSATGSVLNTASVTVPVGITDPVFADNSDTESVILVPEADLSITKTDGVANVTPGGSTTWTIIASNAGPSDATGVTVADTFPAACTGGVNWTASAAGGASGFTAAGSGNINDGPIALPVGASVTYSATCGIDAAAAGTLDNTAMVSSAITDPAPGNNSATDSDGYAPAADLSVTKTVMPGSVGPGGSVTYSIGVANAGPSDVSDAQLSDTFPTGLTCSWTAIYAGGASGAAAGSGNLSETLDLPNGGSATFTASCDIAADAPSGTLGNTASISSAASSDPTPGNNSASVDISVAGGAVISASKVISADTGFAPGSSISYSIVLSNSGDRLQQDNAGDEFSDVLPAGLTLVSASASSGTATANVGTNTVTWNGSIAVGGSVTIGIDASIDADASGDIANQGSVSFDADGNDSNESSDVTDDPSTPAGGDATVFGVGSTAPPSIAAPDLIPATDSRMLALLALMLTLLGGLVLARRQD